MWRWQIFPSLWWHYTGLWTQPNLHITSIKQTGLLLLLLLLFQVHCDKPGSKQTGQECWHMTADALGRLRQVCRESGDYNLGYIVSFRLGWATGNWKQKIKYHHQRKAKEKERSPRDLVVISGTSSGKHKHWEDALRHSMAAVVTST